LIPNKRAPAAPIDGRDQQVPDPLDADLSAVPDRKETFEFCTAIETNCPALRSYRMEQIIRTIKILTNTLGGGRAGAEQAAIPVETVSKYRGNLALGRDRSQHRRYTAHFEDLQN